MHTQTKHETPLQVSIETELCVDLDRSLVVSDTVREILWAALRNHPRACAAACGRFILHRSGTRFQKEIEGLGISAVARLPYRADIVEFLRNESLAGRRVALVTSGDEFVARTVAAHFGFFDDNIATGATPAAKLEAITARCRSFVYVGDSLLDMPIWSASAGAILVGDAERLAPKLVEHGVLVHRRFPHSAASLSNLIRRAARLRQWPKNLLVFAPIFLGHRTGEPGVWLLGAVLFAGISFVASSAYLLNDLLDIDADRQHSNKRFRPIASGELSIPAALIACCALFLAGVLAALFLPPQARLWMAIYFVGTLAYSLWLKTKLLADVVALAALYVIRVLAGGAATGILISPWTLAFCMFLFYSLALTKRYGELLANQAGGQQIERRSYRAADLPIIAALGVCSGSLSVVVFALYISSPDVQAHYRSPAWLWLMCPVILFWFGRLWLLVNRGAVAEDPVAYAFRDRVSYAAAACMFVLWLAASNRW